MPGRSPLDALLTYVGCYLVAFVPTSAVVAAVSDAGPFLGPVRLGATAAVAVPLAAAYWRARLSLGDLGEFVFTTAALVLLLGFPLLLVLGVLDAAPATGTPASVVLDVAFLAVVYAMATLFVYGGGRTRPRGA